MKEQPRGRARIGDEAGVFVPGLMGAGILLSMAMLVADGVRKLAPIDGEKARAARITAVAKGRVADLLALPGGEPPRPFRVRRVPRSRRHSLLLGLVSGATALVLFSTTWQVYEAETGVLADRGWTLSFGFVVTGLFALAAVIWLLGAAIGGRGPWWWERTAGWGVLGTLPPPQTDRDPWLAAYEGRAFAPREDWR